MKEKFVIEENDRTFTMKVQERAKDYSGLEKIVMRVTTKKRDVKLAIVMSKASGQPAVADYELEDVLLSRQYRAQFNRMLRESSVEEFLERLVAKLP